MNRNATFTILTALVLAATACSTDKKDYDATGTFEATEVTVSAEQNGRLMDFTPEEGQTLQAGQQVGLIDTVQLWLKARQAGVPPSLCRPTPRHAEADGHSAAATGQGAAGTGAL